jgi:phosphoribosylformimino-5-aminoimidazole carboxamide ribonucleotide (ProFAR) isomerase
MPKPLPCESESLDLLSEYCSELLVHAADVEGLCQGIDEELVSREWLWLSKNLLPSIGHVVSQLIAWYGFHLDVHSEQAWGNG